MNPNDFAKPTPGNVIRPHRCEKCAWATPSHNNKGLLDCKRYPPTLTVFPVQDQAGRMAFQEYTCDPKVQPENWCGEFKPRIEGLNG